MRCPAASMCQDSRREPRALQGGIHRWKADADVPTCSYVGAASETINFQSIGSVTASASTGPTKAMNKVQAS